MPGKRVTNNLIFKLYTVAIAAWIQSLKTSNESEMKSRCLSSKIADNNFNKFSSENRETKGENLTYLIILFTSIKGAKSSCGLVSTYLSMLNVFPGSGNLAFLIFLRNFSI